MDPLDAPLPGVMRQKTENQPWLDELEESFFTLPPTSREVEPDGLDAYDETEADDVHWRGHSPWPARLFVGACVGVVVVATLALLPLQLFGPDAVRYPVDEVIGTLETGPDTNAPRTTSTRTARSGKRAARKAPAKKLPATRPWTLPAAEKPVPGPVPSASTRSALATPTTVDPPAPGPVDTTVTAPAAERAVPMRVDALPAANLAELEPGAAL